MCLHYHRQSDPGTLSPQCSVSGTLLLLKRNVSGTLLLLKRNVSGTLLLLKWNVSGTLLLLKRNVSGTLLLLKRNVSGTLLLLKRNVSDHTSAVKKKRQRHTSAVTEKRQRHTSAVKEKRHRHTSAVKEKRQRHTSAVEEKRHRHTSAVKEKRRRPRWRLQILRAKALTLSEAIVSLTRVVSPAPGAVYWECSSPPARGDCSMLRTVKKGLLGKGWTTHLRTRRRRNCLVYRGLWHRQSSYWIPGRIALSVGWPGTHGFTSHGDLLRLSRDGGWWGGGGHLCPNTHKLNLSAETCPCRYFFNLYGTHKLRALPAVSYAAASARVLAPSTADDETQRVSHGHYKFFFFFFFFFVKLISVEYENYYWGSAAGKHGKHCLGGAPCIFSSQAVCNPGLGNMGLCFYRNHSGILGKRKLGVAPPKWICIMVGSWVIHSIFHLLCG